MICTTMAGLVQSESHAFAACYYGCVARPICLLVGGCSLFYDIIWAFGILETQVDNNLFMGIGISLLGWANNTS